MIRPSLARRVVVIFEFAAGQLFDLTLLETGIIPYEAK
jgi:hypothetical protein